MAGRRIELQGAFNFRDVGGLTTSDGRTVAVGRIFRSDALHRLDDNDLRVLSTLDIARVFDLRSNAELASDGVGEFSRAMHVHVPLVEVTLSPFDTEIDWAVVDLQDRYLEMLSTGGAAIRAVAEAAAVPHARPILFHCTGGKDRTGVVAAVIQRAIGVQDDAIVADYAVSETYLREFIQPYRDELLRRRLAPDLVAYLTSSPPERMRHTLAELDRRWGSTRDYLASIGVDDSVVDGLRGNLLA